MFVCWFVGRLSDRLVGWSVCHNFLKGMGGYTSNSAMRSLVPFSSHSSCIKKGLENKKLILMLMNKSLDKDKKRDKGDKKDKDKDKNGTSNEEVEVKDEQVKEKVEPLSLGKPS